MYISVKEKDVQDEEVDVTFIRKFSYTYYYIILNLKDKYVFKWIIDQIDKSYLISSIIIIL